MSLLKGQFVPSQLNATVLSVYFSKIASSQIEEHGVLNLLDAFQELLDWLAASEIIQ